jgi:hypothetical protein
MPPIQFGYGVSAVPATLMSVYYYFLLQIPPYFIRKKE